MTTIHHTHHHRLKGESPRYPSPWTQAISSNDINLHPSPIPTPLISLSLNNSRTHLPHLQDRIPSEERDTSLSPSPPSHSTSLPRTPKTESFVLAPSPDGTRTKLAAERDKAGHIEYKLKLDAPSGGERFERLVTQLRWRLTQGAGEAIYELGILDNGTLLGLPPTLMSNSLLTLERMAEELGATVILLRIIRLINPSNSTGPDGEGESEGGVKRETMLQIQEKRVKRRRKEKERIGLSVRERKRMGFRAGRREEGYEEGQDSEDDQDDRKPARIKNSSPPSDPGSKGMREDGLDLKTMTFNGKVYGPSDEWPVLPPTSSPGLDCDPESLTPTTNLNPGAPLNSWKQRNLASYASKRTFNGLTPHTSLSLGGNENGNGNGNGTEETNGIQTGEKERGNWKAKRLYDPFEKEIIRRERRERKKGRRSGGKRDDGREVKRDEEVFEMDGDVGFGDPTTIPREGSSEDDDGVEEDYIHPIQHKSQPLPDQDLPKRKTRLRKTHLNRLKRKESRRLDLLRGDGLSPNGVPLRSARAEDGFGFDMEDEEEEEMGGFGLMSGGGGSEDEVDVLGMIGRMNLGLGSGEKQIEVEELDGRGMKTPIGRSPKAASVFTLPSGFWDDDDDENNEDAVKKERSGSNACHPEPSSLLPDSDLDADISLAHAQVCDMDASSPITSTSRADGFLSDGEHEHDHENEYDLGLDSYDPGTTRLCVEALVVKKYEPEDGLYLDLSRLMDD